MNGPTTRYGQQVERSLTALRKAQVDAREVHPSLGDPYRVAHDAQPRVSSDFRHDYVSFLERSSKPEAQCALECSSKVGKTERFFDVCVGVSSIGSETVSFGIGRGEHDHGRRFKGGIGAY